MKYLKGTLLVLAVAFLCKGFGVSALTYKIQNITIPSFSGVWYSPSREKWETNYQYVKKTSCSDNLTGDGRAISGKLHGQYSGMEDTSYVSLPLNSNVNMGYWSQQQGAWKLYLRSDKSLVTTATLSGVWTIE